MFGVTSIFTIINWLL